MRKTSIATGIALLMNCLPPLAHAKDGTLTKAEAKKEAALRDEWTDRCPPSQQILQYSADTINLCQTPTDKDYFQKYFIVYASNPPVWTLPKTVSNIPSNLGIVAADQVVAWIPATRPIDNIRIYLQHDVLNSPECYLAASRTDELERTVVTLAGPLDYCVAETCAKTYARLEFTMYPPYCDSFEAFKTKNDSTVERAK